MGLYADHVLPRLLDVACGSKPTRPLRARVCTGLQGEVLEVGFGSGHNVPHYPAAVTGVDAVEPSDLAWRLSAERRASSATSVRRSALDGQRLPFPDGSHDAALSTWTLCTIPDVAAALGEIRRVLKPGGRLHFLEHGLAPDAAVRRWQHRLEPVQRRVAGGCRLTLPIRTLLIEAGLTVESIDEFYEQGAPRVLGADYLGVAVSRG